MDSMVIASSEADARAGEAVRRHHDELAAALGLRVEAVLSAAEEGRTPAGDRAREDLKAWCERELVPHALAEEKAMYPAAAAMSDGRLLVAGMLAEHSVITGLVAELAGTGSTLRAAAAARALQVVFESHLAKENDLVLPLLAASPEVSVADLLAGMHELLGGEERGHADDAGAPTGEAGEHEGCACGEREAEGYPELDARAVPHAIRHATVLGALGGVRAGAGMVLLAPHDPGPLLAQVEQRFAGAFTVRYLERGPDVWRIELVRG